MEVFFFKRPIIKVISLHLINFTNIYALDVYSSNLPGPSYIFMYVALREKKFGHPCLKWKICMSLGCF